MASVLRRSRRIIACDSIKSRPLVYSSANDLHNDLIHRSAWAVGFLSGIDFTGTAPAVHTPPPEGTMSRVIVDASLQEPLARLLTIFIGWFVAACELPVVVDDATHRVFMAKLVDLQKPAGQELLKEIIRVGRCAGKFPQLHLVLETVCRLRVYWQLLTANHRAGVHRTGAGVFRDDIRLDSIAKNVLDGVVAQTLETYPCCPEFVISAEDTCLTHAEPNLSYIFAEVMKNASRATVEEHLRKQLPIDQVPPVHINIRSKNGGKEVEAEFIDAGAGICEHELDRVWEFGYTTNATKYDEAVTKCEAAPVVAGYGLGLPMSRLYAEQFGGSLTIGGSEAGCSVVFRHGREGAEKQCPFLPPPFIVEC